MSKPRTLRSGLNDGKLVPIKTRVHWWTIRGTVDVADLPTHDGMTVEIARRLSDQHLHLYPEYRTMDRVGRSIVQAELRRREGWTARLALGISFAALIVSVAKALFD